MTASMRISSVTPSCLPSTHDLRGQNIGAFRFASKYTCVLMNRILGCWVYRTKSEKMIYWMCGAYGFPLGRGTSKWMFTKIFRREIFTKEQQKIWAQNHKCP